MNKEFQLKLIEKLENSALAFAAEGNIYGMNQCLLAIKNIEESVENQTPKTVKVMLLSQYFSDAVTGDFTKIGFIKAVRQATKVALKEAKDFSEASDFIEFNSAYYLAFHRLMSKHGHLYRVIKE